MIERRGLTLVGIAVAQPRRRRAPSSSRCRSTAASGSALDAALDEVRDRFGPDAITRAVLLGRDRRADDAAAPRLTGFKVGRR